MNATNLVDLLNSLRANSESLDMSSLPTFGGEPIDRMGVWSWDETHMIIGEGVTDMKIVPRGYFAE